MICWLGKQTSCHNAHWQTIQKLLLRVCAPRHWHKVRRRRSQRKQNICFPTLVAYCARHRRTASSNLVEEFCWWSSSKVFRVQEQKNYLPQTNSTWLDGLVLLFCRIKFLRYVIVFGESTNMFVVSRFCGDVDSNQGKHHLTRRMDGSTLLPSRPLPANRREQLSLTFFLPEIDSEVAIRTEQPKRWFRCVLRLIFKTE